MLPGLSGLSLMRLLFLGSLAAILTALAFEHFGGFAPCPLCLTERVAYYAAVTGSLIAMLMYQAGRRGMASMLLVAIAIGFLINTGLGVYHSGIEWKWWPGPATCSGAAAVTTDAGSLLDKLNTMHVVRCDEAPFRMLFLSFAGWSALLSLALAVVAGLAALRTGRMAAA